MEREAVIIGSFILFALDIMLDKGDKVKGTTIKLRQHIYSKLSSKEYICYREDSNRVWDKTIDELKNDALSFTVAQFVEHLVLGNTQIMVPFYGDKIVTLADRFSMKHTIPNLDSKYVKDTIKLVDTLMENIR